MNMLGGGRRWGSGSLRTSQSQEPKISSGMLGLQGTTAVKVKHKTRKENVPATNFARPHHLPQGLHSFQPTPRISLAKSTRLVSGNPPSPPMLSFSSLATAEQCYLGFLIVRGLIGNRKAEDKFGSGVVTIMRNDRPIQAKG